MMDIITTLRNIREIGNFIRVKTEIYEDFEKGKITLNDIMYDLLKKIIDINDSSMNALTDFVNQLDPEYNTSILSREEVLNHLKKLLNNKNYHFKMDEFDIMVYIRHKLYEVNFCSQELIDSFKRSYQIKFLKDYISDENDYNLVMKTVLNQIF
jgi:hypothetical protein